MQLTTPSRGWIAARRELLASWCLALVAFLILALAPGGGGDGDVQPLVPLQPTAAAHASPREPDPPVIRGRHDPESVFDKCTPRDYADERC